MLGFHFNEADKTTLVALEIYLEDEDPAEAFKKIQSHLEIAFGPSNKLLEAKKDEMLRERHEKWSVRGAQIEHSLAYRFGWEDRAWIKRAV